MYLLNAVNTYKVATEQQALKLRDELNDSPYGELTAFSYTMKQIKQKGEILDTYYIVKAKLVFNSEKEAEAETKIGNIIYEVVS